VTHSPDIDWLVSTLREHLAGTPAYKLRGLAYDICRAASVELSSRGCLLIPSVGKIFIKESKQRKRFYFQSASKLKARYNKVRQNAEDSVYEVRQICVLCGNPNAGVCESCLTEDL
jgi:hypothetical protein